MSDQVLVGRAMAELDDLSIDQGSHGVRNLDAQNAHGRPPEMAAIADRLKPLRKEKALCNAQGLSESTENNAILSGAHFAPDLL